MARQGTLAIRIVGDTDDLKKKLNGTEQDLGRFGNTAQKVGKAAAVAFAAIGVAGIAMAKGALDAAAEAAKVGAQTEAVLKSTGGAAGVTAEHVGDLAHELQLLSGVSDENIQTGQNMLLTFTNIQNRVGEGNAIFDEATKTMLDMSVAMGTDAKNTAMQLGKALNDPVAGISALTRVGVTFTDQQKEQIKTMVEAGDVAGAQKVILAELNTEFGGSAKAAGDAMTPMERLGMKWGDMQEQLGTWLIPRIEKLVAWLEKSADWFERNADVLIPLIVTLGSAAAAVAVVSTALGVATSAAALFGVTLTISLGPVYLITAAVAALAAGLVYAYTQSDTFRAVVDTVFRAVSDVVGLAIRGIIDLFGGMVDTWLGAVEWIVKGADKAFGWVPGVGSKLRTAAEAVEGFRDRANGALDAIRDKTITVTIREQYQRIDDAQARNRANLMPRFDTGGIVPGPRGAPVVAMLHGGETVLPTHKQRPATSGARVVVPVSSVRPGDLIDGRDILEKLVALQRVNGPLQLEIA